MARLNKSDYVAKVSALLTNVVIPATTKVITSGPAAGKTIFLAAPAYGVGAAIDTWLSSSVSPSYFTDQNILDQINVYIGNPDGDGNFVCFVDTASTFYYQAGDLGGIDANHRGLGDPVWAGIYWCLDYYNRTGSLAPFLLYKDALKTNLLSIPRNDTTHLVFVPLDAGHVWRPMGFQDGINKAGDDLYGSVFYWKAAKDLATLYALSGDSTTADALNADAALISANIATLYDNTSGMFFSCSVGGNATNIDITASALAVYFGLTTNSQAMAISNWIARNYNAAIGNSGFPFQSPTIWGGPRTGGMPYGTGGYDDAYWAFGIYWIVYATAIMNKKTAANIVRRYCLSLDPSMEWSRRPGHESEGILHGNTSNIASIYQGIAACGIDTTN